MTVRVLTLAVSTSIILVATATALLLQQAAHAEDREFPLSRPPIKHGLPAERGGGSSQLYQRIYQFISLANFPPSIPIQVNYDRVGCEVTDVKVKGLDEFSSEVACIEAVYQAVSLEPADSKKSNLFLWFHSANKTPKIDKSIADFYRKHPDLTGKAVIHLIPLSLSAQMQNADLRTASNLTCLEHDENDRAVALRKLREIYKDWSPYLISPKSYSRDDIIEHAIRIKAKYKLQEGRIPPGAD